MVSDFRGIVDRQRNMEATVDRLDRRLSRHARRLGWMVVLALLLVLLVGLSCDQASRWWLGYDADELTFRELRHEMVHHPEHRKRMNAMLELDRRVTTLADELRAIEAEGGVTGEQARLMRLHLRKMFQD